MSSRGGEPITPEEAKDFLHKLITEATKVDATFVSGDDGTIVVLSGSVQRATVRVGEFEIVERRGDSGSPFLRFNLSAAELCSYGDHRSLPSFPDVADAFKANFSSALTFKFKGGSMLLLLERKGLDLA
jgi:hypothetical protein